MLPHENKEIFFHDSIGLIILSAEIFLTYLLAARSAGKFWMFICAAILKIIYPHPPHPPTTTISVPQRLRNFTYKGGGKTT